MIINIGYGICVYGDNSFIEYNREVSGNSGGIFVIGGSDILMYDNAFENNWVGIYMQGDTLGNGIHYCTSDNNKGLGIVASGQVLVDTCNVESNLLDGILAIGTVGLAYNQISYNGENGIFSYGNNLMAFNYGTDNSLIGIMEDGDPLLLAAPNSVEGFLGSEMPATAQILELASDLDTYGLVSFMMDNIEQTWISLQNSL